MPTVDPATRFWIGIIITLAIGVSNGSVALVHAIPQDWIPYATAWCGIISFIGSAILTALNGVATTTSSRIASAAADPRVEKIVTSSQAIADAGGDKVVTK
jgi:hypothetical protein